MQHSKMHQSTYHQSSNDNCQLTKHMSSQDHNEEQMQENAGRQIGLANNDPIESIRLLCLQQGAEGILELGKTFRQLDWNHSGDLTLDEFKNGLNDTGFGCFQLNDQHLDKLFKKFDLDKNGSIKYEELIRAIRPPMNRNRLNTIMKAFEKINKTNDGVITIGDMKNSYDVRSLPEYQNGDKSEDEVIHSFLKKFEEGGCINGQITRDEFVDYYSGVSASIDDDTYFELMLRQAWKLQ